jgi:hypothetical protein
MAFWAKCKFTDWLVRPRKVYVPQLRFGPHTFLSRLTNQSVNLHIALKAMYYLLNKYFDKTAPIRKQRNDVIVSKRLIHKQADVISYIQE